MPDDVEIICSRCAGLEQRIAALEAALKRAINTCQLNGSAIDGIKVDDPTSTLDAALRQARVDALRKAAILAEAECGLNKQDLERMAEEEAGRD